MPRCQAWLELGEVTWGRFPVALRWCGVCVLRALGLECPPRSGPGKVWGRVEQAVSMLG